MNFLKENKLSIILFILGLAIGLFLMSLKVKDNKVKLDNDNTILSLKDSNITSNEYYDLLKDNSGINLLLDLIDRKILEEKYEISADELEEIKKEMNDVVTSYTNYYGIDEKEFYKNNGFKDQDDFKNYLILEKRREKYEKDYLKDIITSNEINYYYNNKLEKDFEIKYLKGKEEVLTKVLTDLKNKLSIEEIVKKYPSLTYKNLGYITFDDKNINEDIYNDAKLLDENSYTTTLRSIDNDYYIIFKGKVKEKDKLENIRDRIIEKIILEKIKNDQDNKLYYEALINLRKENELTFYDTYLDNLYKAYLKSVK